MTLARALRVAAAAALALALLGVGRPAAPRSTVLVLDRSASVTAAARAAEAAWVERFATAGCAAPGCPVVEVAAAAQVEPAAAAPGTVPGARASDVAAGIAAAARLARPGGRVVVLSDGDATGGDAAAAARAARAAGLEVDGVALPEAGVDAAIVRADAPAAIHVGDPVPLLATVRSTVAASARLEVSRDGGRAAAARVVLHTGDNPFDLSYAAAGVGSHSFRVRVVLPGDAVPANDALSTAVSVVLAPRVVVATSTPDDPLVGALARAGLRPRVVAPRGLPSSAAGYAGVDAVVLDDVAAPALGAARERALAGAVRLGGLGLLGVGGPHSFSLGGYAGTPLDALLPVASRVPGNLQRRDLALELVVDRSGSMGDRSEGVRKLAMAQRAALAAVDFAAAHADELGVVDFDIAPHVGVPLARVTTANRNAVAARVRRVTAAGGTDIYLGLRAGLRQLLTSRSSRRHLILLSDGISQPHDYTALLARLRRAHVAVATVALGAAADRSLLRRIADGTGGTFYATSDPRALPRIFAREARLSSRPAVLTGHLAVASAAATPVTRSLAGHPLPALAGVVATDARPTAQVDLVAGAKAAPALVQWQLGVGRVVAWLPGVGAPWAAAWSARATFLGDAVRWVDRAASTAGLRVTGVAGANGSLAVDTSALGPQAAGTAHATVDGRAITLVQEEPGRFEAAAPWLTPGTHRLALRLAHGPVRATVAVPYPAEFRPAEGSLGTLGVAVAAGGGRLLPAGDAGLLGRRGTDLRPWLALAGALLFCAGAFVGLLRGR